MDNQGPTVPSCCISLACLDAVSMLGLLNIHVYLLELLPENVLHVWNQIPSSKTTSLAYAHVVSKAIALL